MSTDENARGGGFSDAELAAMKERAAEMRAEKGGKKKADFLAALWEKIDEMPEDEKEIAAGVHRIVEEVAPDLVARTWYGMPAYERSGSGNRGGGVILFVQPASKFGARYTTLGFNDGATLDDGEMWPTSFAIPAWGDAVRERVTELVRAATTA